MNVDKIYVISLKKSKKRRENLKKLFTGVDVDFFIVNRMKNPERGCYSSHQNVLRDSLRRGYSRILVMEDDAYPLFSWNKIKNDTNRCIDFLDKNEPKWKFLQLGYLPFRNSLLNDFIFKVSCNVDAHAYIVNLKNISTNKWNGFPIDEFLFCGNKTGVNFLENSFKNNNIEVYATFPMLITQKTDKSTIAPIHMHQRSFIDFFGGEQNISKLSTSVNPLFLFIFIILIFFLLFIFIISCSCCYFDIITKNSLYCISMVLFIILFVYIIILISQCNLKK